MNQKEIRRILAERFVDLNGYKNPVVKKANIKKNTMGILFTIAPIIVMSLFVFFTMIYGTLFISSRGQLTADLSGIKHSSFTHNLSLLAKDKLFHSAVKNTFIFSLVILGFSLIWSLFVAMILNLTKIRGKKLFLIGYFLPQVTSSVASTIVFVTMLTNPLNINNNPANWFWIVVISGLWFQTASSIVTFNTAFAGVSRIEYEAAKLDGANGFVRFFKITIPALGPIIAYQIIMTLVFGMTAFGQSFIIMALGYVEGTEAQKNVILWPVIGFMRVKGGSGIQSNVGLGMIILLLLGITLFILSFIATLIGGVQKTKGNK